MKKLIFWQVGTSLIVLGVYFLVRYYLIGDPVLAAVATVALTLATTVALTATTVALTVVTVAVVGVAVGALIFAAGTGALAAGTGVDVGAGVIAVVALAAGAAGTISYAKEQKLSRGRVLLALLVQFLIIFLFIYLTLPTA